METKSEGVFCFRKEVGSKYIEEVYSPIDQIVRDNSNKAAMQLAKKHSQASYTDLAINFLRNEINQIGAVYIKENNGKDFEFRYIRLTPIDKTYYPEMGVKANWEISGNILSVPYNVIKWDRVENETYVICNKVGDQTELRIKQSGYFPIKQTD